MVQHCSVHLLGLVSVCFTALISANEITIQMRVVVPFFSISFMHKKKRNPSYSNRLRLLCHFLSYLVQPILRESSHRKEQPFGQRHTL